MILRPLVKQYHCSRCSNTFYSFFGISDLGESRQHARIKPGKGLVSCVNIEDTAEYEVLNISEGGMMIEFSAKETILAEKLLLNLTTNSISRRNIVIPAAILSRRHIFQSGKKYRDTHRIRLQFQPESTSQKESLSRLISSLTE